jgi:lysozyme family protein
MTRFDIAFKQVVGEEGGYSDNPKDPGGATKYGISHRSYPFLDIKNLTLENAKAIYERDYWNACRCREIAEPLDLFLFDAAVNQGVKTAIKILQRSLGLDENGVITIALVHSANASGREGAMLFLTARVMRYEGTKGFSIGYGKGWIKRLFALCYAGATV